MNANQTKSLKPMITIFLPSNTGPGRENGDSTSVLTWHFDSAIPMQVALSGASLKLTNYTGV